MNRKQFGNWNIEVLLATIVALFALIACNLPFGQKQEAVPTPNYDPKPGATPMPYGIGKIVITPREDLDPLTEGNQIGVSISLNLSLQDPNAVKYQYFAISGAKGPIYILNGYETPVGDVTLGDFLSPVVSFDKNGVTYFCPPVDANNPYVVDCGGVLDILLSN